MNEQPVEMLTADRDSLRCLFYNGPTWDGDIPSKMRRSELVRLGLAERANGYNWLTRAGVLHCLSLGMDREKDRWQRDRHEAMAQYKPLPVVMIVQGRPSLTDVPPERQ